MASAAMFEPLLQVTLPDEQVLRIDGPERLDHGATRKVIVLGQVWAMNWAEKNLAAIAKRLLDTGKIQLIALGDYSDEARGRFPRPSLDVSSNEMRERLKSAEDDLLAGRTGLVAYLGLAAPLTVPLIGANRADLLEKAREARARRKQALEWLYLWDACEPDPVECESSAQALGGSIAETESRTCPESFRLIAGLVREQLGIDLSALFKAADLERLPGLLEEKFKSWFSRGEIQIDINGSTTCALERSLGIELGRFSTSELVEKLEMAFGGKGTADANVSLGGGPTLDELRRFWERELGLLLSEEQGPSQLDMVPALVAKCALVAKWLDPPPPLPDLNSSSRPVPILKRMRDHLRAATRQRTPNSPVHLLEELFRKVSQSMGCLPALLQFAERRGLDVDLYPHLQVLCTGVQSDRLDRHRLGREQKWLTQAVLSRLIGGRVDSYGGVRGIFDMEMRRIFHTGEDRLGLLSSSQPLKKCANAASSRLMAAALGATERNQDLSISCARELLDLASLLQLNDSHYELFRTYVNSRSDLSLTGILTEMDGLKWDLVTLLSVAYPLDCELYELGQAIDDLDKLSTESLSAEEAERMLTRLSSASTIVERLEEFGEKFSEPEKQQVRYLDEECIPPALAFYESSQEQASVMADSVLRGLSRYQAETAILLCGGYHPQAVVRELTASQQVACSIIVPQIDERKEGRGRQVDLDQLRKASEMSPEFNVVHLGGDRLRELARSYLRKGAEQRAVARQGEIEDDKLGFFDRVPDVREWIQFGSGSKGAGGLGG